MLFIHILAYVYHYKVSKLFTKSTFRVYRQPLALLQAYTPLIETELELTGDFSTLQMKVMDAPSRILIRLAALEGRSHDKVL